MDSVGIVWSLSTQSSGNEIMYILSMYVDKYSTYCYHTSAYSSSTSAPGTC